MAAGRDAGCEAKAGQRARPPSDFDPTRAAALDKVLLSTPAHSASWLRWLRSAFATALSPFSPSSLCLSVPPSSSVPAPFPRPACRRSLPLSPSVCPWPMLFPSLFFAQFQRLSEPVSLQRNGRHANSGLDRAKRESRALMYMASRSPSSVQSQPPAFPGAAHPVAHFHRAAR